MIKGIGIDTVEISRIQRFLDDDNQALLNRLFTDHEQQYCRRRKQAAACLAARFAAKEAAFKTLPFDRIALKKIEVIKDAQGKPQIILHDKRAEGMEFKISLSHTDTYATAFAVALKK